MILYLQIYALLLIILIMFLFQLDVLSPEHERTPDFDRAGGAGGGNSPAGARAARN